MKMFFFLSLSLIFPFILIWLCNLLIKFAFWRERDGFINNELNLHDLNFWNVKQLEVQNQIKKKQHCLVRRLL